MARKPEELKTFRTSLKEISPTLKFAAEKDKTRSYIPATFDTMMQDFGNRFKRREINDKHSKITQQIIKDGGRLPTPALKQSFQDNRDVLEEKFENTRESF
jgi:hypothetical protein